jgi:hypothetical protein
MSGMRYETRVDGETFYVDAIPGEEVLRLSDDMKVFTFYDDNEVVLTLRVDGIGRFVGALKDLVAAMEGQDHDYATGWSRMDAVETVKEVLGMGDGE